MRDQLASALTQMVRAQEFEEDDIVRMGVVPVLIGSLKSMKAAAEAPGWGAVALQWLGQRCLWDGPVERELIKQKALNALIRCAEVTPNLETRRLACKAIHYMAATPNILAASGLTLDQVIGILEAQGKTDYICSRWHRETQKYKTQVGQPRKDWWED